MEPITVEKPSPIMGAIKGANKAPKTSKAGLSRRMPAEITSPATSENAKNSIPGTSRLAISFRYRTRSLLPLGMSSLRRLRRDSSILLEPISGFGSCEKSVIAEESLSFGLDEAANLKQ